MNTPDTGNFSSSTEQIRVGRSCLTVLVPLRQFLDVVSFTDLHKQIQLLGFGTSLNSIVAASIEHPVHLSIFQLSERLITRSKFSHSRQFGAFSLWRKLRWSPTPLHLRRALHSPLFYRRVLLWEIIQDLGSNSIRRFHMEKRSAD